MTFKPIILGYILFFCCTTILAAEINKIEVSPLPYYDRQGKEQGELSAAQVNRLKLPLKIIAEHAGYLHIKTADGHSIWLDELDVIVKRTDAEQRIVCERLGEQKQSGTEHSAITPGGTDLKCP